METIKDSNRNRHKKYIEYPRCSMKLCLHVKITLLNKCTEMQVFEIQPSV